MDKTKNSPIKLTKLEWIMALLFAPGQTGKIREPIEGRLKIMKELFVIERELKPSNFYSFNPYLYGAYSREVFKDLSELLRNNLIKVTNEYKEGYGTYTLTEKGEEMIAEKYRLLSEDVRKKIEEIKKELNNLSFLELLTKVYGKYPEFAKNSMVRIPKELNL